MRRERLRRIRVIREDNPELFEKQVNAIYEQLAKENIEPKEAMFSLNPLTAIIPYERTEYIAQNEADRKALKGNNVVCRNCKYYERGIDYRIGFCNLKDKQVYAERFACKHISEGEENDD